MPQFKFKILLFMVLGVGCGKVQIESSCLMTGSGVGSCSFTNKGTKSGALCGFVKVMGSGSYEKSHDFCSGNVEPSSTTKVDFTIPAVSKLCSGAGDWSDICSFGFVADETSSHSIPVGSEGGPLGPECKKLQENAKKMCAAPIDAEMQNICNDDNMKMLQTMTVGVSGLTEEKCAKSLHGNQNKTDSPPPEIVAAPMIQKDKPVTITISVAADCTETTSGIFFKCPDNSIYDKARNLFWASSDNGSDIDFDKAKAYCESGGNGTLPGSGWRMPSFTELKGLYAAGLRVGDPGITKIILTGYAPWANDTELPSGIELLYDCVKQNTCAETGGYWAASVDFLVYAAFSRVPRSKTSLGRALPVRDNPVQEEKLKEPDFRNANWGMDRSEIKETESDTILTDDENGLYYQSQFGDTPAVVVYKFENEKLTNGVIRFVTKNSPSEYIDLYNETIDSLTEKLGKPQYNELKWKNEKYKDNPSKYATALSKGFVDFEAGFLVNKTIIYVFLSKGEDGIGLGIIYKIKN